MLLNGPITTLPPYADPILSAVSRALQCSLGEYVRRPTGTVIELESRLGQLIAASRLNVAGLPIISSSNAVLHSKNQHIYRFKSELPLGCFSAMENALRGVHLIGNQGRQWGTTSSHISNSNTLLLITTQGHRLSYAIPSYPEVRTNSPLRVGRLKSVMLKSATHTTDVCCPEWGWDFRLAVANERSIAWRTSTSSSPNAGVSCGMTLEGDKETARDAVLDLSTIVPQHVRIQKRHRFPIRPFFCVELSNERVLHSPSNFLQANNAKLESFVIPSSFGVRSEVRVEVEVDLPTLYKAWKSFGQRRLHGLYRGTTAAVRSCSELAKEEQTASEVHTHAALDPFLRHVALEWLALLQFMCSVRPT